MTAQGQNQPSLPSGPTQIPPEQVTAQLYLAINAAAQAGAVTQTPGEMEQASGAALKFAQALVILDPSLSQGGTPLEHDLAVKQIEGQTQQAVAQIQGEHALKIAQQSAAAPSPAKRAGNEAPSA